MESLGSGHGPGLRQNKDLEDALHLSSIMTTKISSADVDRNYVDRTVIALHEELKKSKQETLAVLESVSADERPFLSQGLSNIEQLEQQARTEWQNALELLEEEQRGSDLAREISKAAMDELIRTTSTFTAEIEHLRAERATLEQRAANVPDNNRFAQELEQVRALNETLNAQLDGVLSARDELSQSQIQAETKCNDLKEKLMTSLKNLTAKNEQITELQATTQKLTAQITSLSTNLDSERSRVADLQTFVSRLQGEAETLNTRARELSQTLEKSVKARNEEAEQARTQIQKLESELDIHKKANDSLETLTRELSEEKKALALRVQEASADNNTISDLQTELKATKEAIRQATDDLNSSVALLKETKDKLAAEKDKTAILTERTKELENICLQHRPSPEGNTMALLKETLAKNQTLSTQNSELLDQERKSSSSLKVNMEKVILGMKENESQRIMTSSSMTQLQLERDSYIAEMDLIGQILGQIEDTVPTVRDFYVQDALSSTTLPRDHAGILSKLKALRNFLEESKHSTVSLARFSQGQMVMVKSNEHSFFELVKKEEGGPHYFLDPDCWAAWNTEMQNNQVLFGQIVFIGERKRNNSNEYNLVPGEEYHLVYLAKLS